MKEKNELEDFLSLKEFCNIIRLEKSPIFVVIALLFQIPILNIVLLYVFFSFSYIFNDLLDVEKDKHRKDKILPKKSKRVLQKLVIINYVLLGVIIVGAFLLSLKLVVVYLLGIFISVYYSYYLKNFFPSFAIQVWCFIAVSVSLYQSPHFSVVWLIVLFLLFYIREIPLDVRDSKDDSIHCVTPPLTKVHQ